MAFTDDLAQAIATFEGFYKPGSLAQRNNNPGNLRSWGGLPTANGYAVFPTPEAGWDALKRQILLDTGRGLTLTSFLGKYAPASENPTSNYVAFVQGQLGIDPNTPLSAYTASPPNPTRGPTHPPMPGQLRKADSRQPGRPLKPPIRRV